MRHLSLVPRAVRGATAGTTAPLDDATAASASPRASATAGAQTPQPPQLAQGEPVAYVPVKLLLAASGRCSCDDCALEALRERHQPVRTARGTDRQPVRNLHLLS